ncbi:hypothetical protein FDECE_16210 [Fusarium decemcellulare]|nr:hypothetical protein FDECE_16210 [Fusarium decemcellulare]
MSLSRSLVLLVLTLVHPSLAGSGQSLTDICKAVEGTDGCTKSFPIPVDTRLVTDCKSDNICDLINLALQDTEFVDGYSTWCLALPGAIRERKAQPGIWTNGKVNGATTKDINYVVSIEDLEQQVVRQGFEIQNNKQGVISESLANKDGWTVLKAPEVNTASYASLVRSIDLCQTTSCTQRKLDVIRQWFIDWISGDTEIRQGELATLLKGWQDSFKTTWKTKIAAVKAPSTLIETRRGKTSQKFFEIKDTICQNNLCKGKTASAYIKLVTTALQQVDKLADIPYACVDAESSRQYFLANYLNKIQETFNLVPSKLAPKSPFYDLVQGGRLDTLRGLMNGFGTITSDLEYYAKEMKANFYSFKPFKTHGNNAQQALIQINKVLAPDWKNNQELSQTPELRKVRDGFLQIQSIIKGNLQGPLTDLISAIDAFNAEFAKFPLSTKNLKVAYGAVAFERWIDVEFDYPCKEAIEHTFEQDGFSKVFKWTEFTPCVFTTQRFDLIANWIPYFKYRLV